ncbi:unnamed protein product [Prunus armeniaca]
MVSEPLCRVVRVCRPGRWALKGRSQSRDVTIWSGVKPTVDYFKVCGCVSHVHVPDSKRTKLDDKSLRCVLLGVSEESKAYRLYDLVSQKILVSRDVVFEEDKSWDWDKRHEEVILADLEWGNNEKGATRVAENEEEGDADFNNEGAADFDNAT